MSTHKSKRFTAWLTYSFWFLSVVCIDQATKFLFSDQITLNTGISFQLFSGPWLSGILVVLAIIGWWISWKYLEVPRWSHAIFWGAVTANLIDRVVYSGVRDIWFIPGTTIKNNPADWGIALIAVYWMYNIAKRTDLQSEAQ